MPFPPVFEWQEHKMGHFQSSSALIWNTLNFLLKFTKTGTQISKILFQNVTYLKIYKKYFLSQEITQFPKQQEITKGTPSSLWLCLCCQSDVTDSGLSTRRPSFQYLGVWWVGYTKIDIYINVQSLEWMQMILLTLVLLNKLRCYTHF